MLRQHNVYRKFNSQTSLGMHVLWNARHTDYFQEGFPSPRLCIAEGVKEWFSCASHYAVRTEQGNFHYSWHIGMFNRCQILSPLALQGHLRSKFVCTCTGLAFPLEKPLGGAKEWFWDQIFLQGPWGQSPTFCVLEELVHICFNIAKRYRGSFYFTA